jgi:hypothetical protein
MSQRLQNGQSATDAAWLASLVNAFETIEASRGKACGEMTVYETRARLSRPADERLTQCGRVDEALFPGDLQPRPLSLFDAA